MIGDSRTLEVYDKCAAKYEEMAAIEAAGSVLARFVAELPKGGRVLDLGSGPGHHAAQMAETGLDVEAWDGSVEMVSRALNRPGVKARQASFSDLVEIEGFDGIWASFSLLHAPKIQFTQHLASCKRALRPGGVLYIGMKTGTGESYDRLGRFYAYYTSDELEQLLEAAGFHPFWRHSGQAAGLSGDLAPYVGILSRA